MSKPVKEIIARDLEQRYAETRDAVWVEMVGIDGITTNTFRRVLREKEMRLEVVKTSLLRRACKGRPLERLAKQLTGPAALVTGGTSAIDVAKLLEDWAPKFPKEATFRLRGAVLDGEYIGEDQVKDLSRMPTKADLQGRVVRIILTPAANIAGIAVAGGRNIAGALKTLIEKLEKGEEITRRSA